MALRRSTARRVRRGARRRRGVGGVASAPASVRASAADLALGTSLAEAMAGERASVPQSVHVSSDRAAVARALADARTLTRAALARALVANHSASNEVAL